MTEISDGGTIPIGDLVAAKFSYYINTGVPHCVYEVEDLANYDVASKGKRVRDDERFQRGANCNFFQLMGPWVHIRTFERGVEGETMACGTGVMAVALSLYERGDRRESYRCHTLGGEISVEVESPGRVYLCGEVEKYLRESW